MLDFQPAKFFRRQIIRRKFVRRDEAEVAPVIAPLPKSLQQRCIAAPGLLAHVIVSKYCDHQPLYRQIKEQMMRGSYIQVDETHQFAVWFSVNGEFPILAHIQLENGKEVWQWGYLDLPGSPRDK